MKKVLKHPLTIVCSALVALAVFSAFWSCAKGWSDTMFGKAKAKCTGGIFYIGVEATTTLDFPKCRCKGFAVKEEYTMSVDEQALERIEAFETMLYGMGSYETKKLMVAVVGLKEVLQAGNGDLYLERMEDLEREKKELNEEEMEAIKAWLNEKQQGYNL